MLLTIERHFARTLFATACLLPVLTLSLPASAHINLESHMARDGEQDIKDAPCGRAGSTRGSNVYTYKPGATINITVAETISHPGYFRFAFDQDGDDAFENPASISGLGGDCAGDPLCGPGMEDFCTNDAVLLDNLEQHTGSFLGPEVSYTFSVTLPNVECDNCTLQVIQIMADLNVHRAPYPADDIYYQCIDLVLSNDAPDVTDTPVANNGMDCTVSNPAGGAGGTGAGAGSAGMGGAAGMTMAGTGGSGAVSGEPAPMAGTGGVGAGTGGAGGAAGTANSSGAGGMTGASGAGTGGLGGMPGTGAMPGSMMAGAGTANASDDGDESSGCRASGSARSSMASTLAGVLLALATLQRRRRAR